VRLDYTALYKRHLTLDEVAAESASWGCFLSAFNATERVRTVFDVVRTPAEHKHWLVHPEYCFDPTQIPRGSFTSESLNEAEFWDRCWAPVQAGVDSGRPICVDLTGFMRPHLMYLTRKLFDAGVESFWALYSEPQLYRRAEQAVFTAGSVTEVRQVAGFEGIHRSDEDTDLLIIGVGYEDELIRRVAELKRTASRKLQLFGLPSLQPDMYQQSVLKAARAADALGASPKDAVMFAPANDPFATAQELRERVEREQQSGSFANLYLAALGTKPQALGFALFYLSECRNGPTSMLFPYAQTYSPDSAEGLARTWLYEVRLPRP